MKKQGYKYDHSSKGKVWHQIQSYIFFFFFFFDLEISEELFSPADHKGTKSGSEKVSSVGSKTTRPRSIVLPNYSKRHEDGSLMFQLIEPFTSNNINIPCFNEV